MPQYNIGIEAYHIHGIDRVEFYLEGYTETPTTVTTPSINPETGNWEYWAKLDTDIYTDGPKALMAIVYPNTAGFPKVLWNPQFGIGELDVHEAGEHYFEFTVKSAEPLTRWVDSVTGSASNPGTESLPMATIYQAAENMFQAQGDLNNTIIKLMEGDHNYAVSQGTKLYDPAAPSPTSWLTIQANDGLDAAQVNITASTLPLDAELVRFKNVRILTQIATVTPADGPIVWFDDCIFNGQGGDINFASRTHWVGGIYLTNCDIKSNARGFEGANMVKGCYYFDIPNEVFKNNLYVTNCLVEGTGGTLENSAFAEFTEDEFHGVLFSNIRAFDRDQRGIVTNQAATNNLFLFDSAFVNVLIEHNGVVNDNYWQIDAKAEHMLFWHCSIVGNNSGAAVEFLWTGNTNVAGGTTGIWGSRYKDIDVRGCIVSDLEITAPTFGVGTQFEFNGLSTFAYNHHFDDAAFGTGSTTSALNAPIFVNPGSNNYHPGINNDLVAAVPRFILYDAENIARAVSATTGALEFQDVFVADGEFAGNGDISFDGEGIAQSVIEAEGSIAFDAEGVPAAVFEASGDMAFDAEVVVVSIAIIDGEGDIQVDGDAVINFLAEVPTEGEGSFSFDAVANVIDPTAEAGLSDYGEETFANHLAGKATAPGMNTHLALCTTQPLEEDTGSTITETTYTGYERLKAFPSEWVIIDNVLQNSVPLTFPRNEDNTEYTISHFAVCLELTTGEMLLYSYLVNPITINTGHAPRIETGALTIQVT